METNTNSNTTKAETNDTANETVDNFLEDVFSGNDGTPENTGSEDGSETNTEEGGEGDDHGNEERFEIEIDSAGEEAAIGDVVKKGGEILSDQEITLEDGSKVRTDKDGKITEVIPASSSEDDSNPNILQFKTTDDTGTEKIEKFDLSKPEDRAKIIEYGQKGRYLEREKSTFNEEKRTFEALVNQHDSTATTLAWNTMYLVSQGKLNNAAFTELPYEDFVGKSAKLDKEGNEIEPATTEGDKKLWSDHNAGVRNNVASLETYKQDYAKTASQFRKMSDELVKKHPEITDAKKWILENVGPYNSPVMTFGKVPYPEDSLEMIYFWKNREKIMNNIREEERRKIAKGKVVKDNNNNNRVATKTKSKVDENVDKFLNNGVFKTSRKIVH